MVRLFFFIKVFFFLIINNCYSAPNFIAHAAGGINGHTYTDSVVAFKNSILLGFKYIELDLQLTADNKLFALHEWEDLIKLEKSNLVISRINKVRELHKNNQLKEKDLIEINKYLTYPIILEKDIMYFLKNYPDIYIVTDKIQNYKKLENFFYGYTHRVYIEINNKLNYVISLFYNIENRMLFIKNLNFKNQFFLGLFKVRNVVTSYDYLSKKNFLQKLENIKKKQLRIFIFTINDRENFLKIKNIADFIYTDFLKP